jgi:hypothetical protein
MEILAWFWLLVVVVGLVLTILDRKTSRYYAGTGEVTDMMDVGNNRTQIRLDIDGCVRAITVDHKEANGLYIGARVDVYWLNSLVWRSDRGSTFDLIV